MRHASRRQMIQTGMIALLMLIAVGGPVSACIWFYGTDIEGNAVKLNEFGPDHYVKYLRDHKYDRPDLFTAPQNPPESVPPAYQERSNYAATLVYKGEYAKAVEIFEELEKSHPGEYIIAANLGTAYELSGDNEKALKWISEGIHRNPKSHYGTEWLHIKILEAKIELAKDPNWLKTHSVLGLNFENEARPKMPWQWPEGQDVKSTQEALEYQLHERLEFVKPPDPIVGELLGDLGNILSLTRSLEHAIAVYDLALTFNPVHADLISKRRTSMQSLVVSHVPEATIRLWLIIFVAGLGISILTILILRRVRKAAA